MTGPKDGTAWITGASSGIGRAVALRLARDGWTVLASARRETALQEVAAEAEGLPGRIVPAPCDVTDREAVGHLVAAAQDKDGGIALAILNAGTFKADSAEDFSSEDFRKTVDINLVGTAHCIQALMPAWMERRRGHLAVVSSVAGYRGLPTAISYGATKAALINMCESLKFDFDRLGLKIQVINPGFVKTPLTDQNPFKMPFIIEVDEAAERIVSGLKKSKFEIAFPWRFVFQLKQLRCLPYEAYFPLVSRSTGK
ncbi:MAG: SDR family NAD(P)-dependent oxidoreductase [Alphaproteobacteria bacterium]|jgi:NAD(P)-dependent dehydrogenase (short-subunit alcohol dehydrogenase family)|nr:SDR family NAD(P)-dependent oxidoreductase [Alphaproteobacteria bacterium]